MKFLPELAYPDDEKPKLALLERLFRDWHQHFERNASVLEKHVADELVADGFYPHYFEQKTKILFIGRESIQIGDCHNMDVLYPAYRDGKTIGGRALDADNFHSRMLRIAYGLTNGMPSWQDIPTASNIGDTFGEAGDLSFAFMNISKLSNESDEFAADWPVINAAYALSTRPRNFIKEEITILEPAIIITMNLADKLEDELESLGEYTLVHASHPAVSYWLDTGGHRSLLIDTFHFAAWTKDDVADFYAPICDAIRRSGALP